MSHFSGGIPEDYEDGNVRVVAGSGEVAQLEQRRERSGPQRHVDVAFDAATVDAQTGHDALQSSVEWMKTIGEVPAEFRNLPLLVSQFQEWIKEKRRVRG